MKLITISLKDGEVKALKKICEVREITSRHRAIKIAINEYIERFNNTEKHHRLPDGKVTECPEQK
jgi:metal-responsive CopG/Arc/MetJ family transcriptional regulator